MNRRCALLAAGLCLAGPALATPSGGDGLAATLERFDHLSVGDAVSVSNLHLTAGHIDCTLRSGRAAPVRVCDEVVGVYFEGDGAMDYLSVDPIEAPVVLYNARKGTSLSPEKSDKGVRLRDYFARMLSLASSTAPPQLSGAPASTLAGGFREQ